MTSSGISAARPVMMPAAITTSTGLKRNTNPTTIAAMPISGQRFTACSIVFPRYFLIIFCL
jgi:hypothetical protein